MSLVNPFGPPRAEKMSVREFAHELGEDPSRVLTLAMQLGMVVRTASSTLEPAEVDRLRAHLLQAARSEGDAIASWLGVAPHRPRSAAQRARRPAPPRPGSMAAEICARWPMIAPAEAEQVAKRWLSRFIEPKTAVAYWDAGLGLHDDAIVARCIERRLPPADLARMADGTRVRNRLRGGEPVDSVVARLHEQDG